MGWSGVRTGREQASMDEDRLPVHEPTWTTDRTLFSDRPPHGRIRTLDQDYHFEVDGG